MDLGIPGLGDAVELGRSPATVTYRTLDPSGRSVVVKVLTREATPEVWARFDYDQQRIEELTDHPNVLSVLAHGVTADRRPYLVMADVPGGSFAQKVGGGLDGLGVVALGIRVAGALESAHRRDVVHGDLRPEDILIDSGGEPEVADFGLAMSTGVGPDRATVPGRLAHAAPEQLTFHVPTPASDVYALGSVLYALLAGAPAFVAPGETSTVNVGMRIATEQPPDLQRLGVPEVVADAVGRAMAKDPAARWSTAEAFGIALQQTEITLGRPLTPMTVVGPDRVVPRSELAGGPENTAAAAPVASVSNTNLLIAAGVLGLVLVALVAFLLFGQGGEVNADDGREPATNPGGDVVEFDLREESDDDGVITLQAPDIWGQSDGSQLGVGDAGTANDLVVANGDPIAFTRELGISGLEATVFELADLDALGLETDADGLRDGRVLDRNLAVDCTTDLPPEDAEIGGFEGSIQRFDDCGSSSNIVVFGGVDGDFGVVIEAHLLNDDDEAALEPVLDSIRIDP
jgi:hypothetical protein